MKPIAITPRRLALVLASLVAMSASSGFAQPSSAECQFLEVRATSGKSAKMDPALAPLANKLTRGPFKSKNTFELLARHASSLSLLKAVPVDLAVGTMSVLFRQHSKPEGKKDRITLQLTMDDEEGKRVLDTKVNVDAGDWILVGRSLNADADHIVGVTCSAK